MRSAASSSAILRSKLTTSEAAMLKEFKDPALEVGAEALLSQKVRAATQKMFQR